ncbi:hypothetical protein R3P38DRAFT_3202578 [Favolaschia claudopus]|uniref:Uncharacterized protein n=1 Tax=Favolaschia claudopus TaxID=2862362 RepID=A0AAW0AU38_9AGAR
MTDTNAMDVVADAPANAVGTPIPAAVDPVPAAVDPAAVNPAPAAADTVNPVDGGEMKRGLYYEVSSTSIVVFLPPVQKDRLVRGWRRRHLEEEHPERFHAREDDEVSARIAASYDISCQCLKDAHALALFKAEELAKKDRSFDSDSDSDDEREPLKPEDIIIWDGTRPEMTARTDAGAAADLAVAADIASDMAEDARTGQAMSVRAVLSNGETVLSNGDKGFFNFVPASLLAAATEDLEIADAYDSERRAAPSPIPSLMSEAASEIGDINDEIGDINDMETAAETATETGDASESGVTHPLELVCVNGVRKVQCKCVDGKHLPCRLRETFAFESPDGTVVVKKFRTIVVALN